MKGSDYAADGFGLANLPYGSYVVSGAEPRLGVRLGEHVLDAGGLAVAGGAEARVREVLDAPNLDALLAAGPQVWAAARGFLQDFLGGDSEIDEALVHPVAEVTMRMPFTVGDYVDFYASQTHASNVGAIFRPGQPALLPNWHHLPIGYHGRSSTVVVSGTEIVRPQGLLPTGPGEAPTFGPSKRLDIEAEIGYVVGGAAPDGRVPLSAAGDFLFGVVVVNDWSARDIQAFEYVPLGPFLGKSFATSVSPWVVPMAALEQARVAPPERVVALADYLDDSDAQPWGLDLELRVEIDGQTLSRPPFRTMYFTGAQMLVHTAVNGAALRPGDFFASGTVSGPEREQFGSLLELSWGGKEPIELGDGATITFLEDGMDVTIAATAPGPNGAVIDLGEVTGRIAPAIGS